MVVRAVVLGVEGLFPYYNDQTNFRCTYKILRRGKKRLRSDYVVGSDELDAYLQMQQRLRDRGYKV